MKKNVFVFMILGVCATMSAGANYPIGTFVAPKGADGAACNATITTERCGPSLETKCYESGQLSAKSGIKMTKTDCSGSNATSFYTYDGDVGTGIYYQGELANCDALYALKNNSDVTKEPGYAWFVKNLGADYDAGKLYIWTDNKFPDCPSGGVPFQGPQGAQGDGVCTGHESDATAVKNTTTTYGGPSGGNGTYYANIGQMVAVHTPCMSGASIPNTTQDDPCRIIAAPAGSGCTGANNTYYECKRQGAQGDNAAGTTYNLCLTTTGNSITSALDNPCYGVAAANQSTTVKKTEWSYTAPAGSGSIKTSVGKLVQKNRMCNDSLSTSSLAEVEDECTEEARPNSGCNGTGKVYKKCRPQGTYTSNTNFSDYYVCVDGTYKDVCLGTASSSLSTTERTQSTAYTVPSGTKTGSGDYSYYTSSPGKMVTTSVKCNPGTNGVNNTVIGSVQDVCDEIAKPTNVCPDTNKKFYQCRPQGKISSSTDPYYLCTDPLGVSVLDTINSAAQSAAETAVAAVDPCAENPASNTIIKTTSTTAYSRGTKTGNLYPNIGSKTVTKTACDGTTTYTTTEQDSCVEIAKPANVCTAATSAYLRCYNAQASSDQTYYVCQDLGANNNSLANKIATAQTTATNAASAAAQAQTTANGKIDASYLSTNGYLTSSSSLPAANLTGTINSGRLPSNVVTTTDNKISASVLPDTVVTTTGGKIDASVLPTSVTTTDNLKQQLLDQTIMGTCTTSGGTGDNAPTTSCTSGSLMEAIYNQLSAAISAASRS